MVELKECEELADTERLAAQAGTAPDLDTPWPGYSASTKGSL
jgi:hypothetical protein